MKTRATTKRVDEKEAKEEAKELNRGRSGGVRSGGGDDIGKEVVAFWSRLIEGSIHAASFSLFTSHAVSTALSTQHVHTK